jgi:hypothetical protein
MVSDRRTFLKNCLSGVVALGVARLFPVSIARAFTGGRAGQSMLFFSEDEYVLMAALAKRIIGNNTLPTDESGIDVVQRADRFLAEEDPELQDQFHLLLTIFDSTIAAFIFNLKFSSFSLMDEQSQDQYIAGWMTSWFSFRRTGYQALKRLCMSMYYTDARSFTDIGFSPAIMTGTPK